MKSKLKYFLLTLLVFVQFSCNDWLELIPPSGLIRDEFWKSKEDVEAVLMAAYESFGSMDRSLFLYGELRGDLLKTRTVSPSTPQNERDVNESNIYPNNSFCNWSNFYKIINYCNEVIKNAPEVYEIDNTFTEFQLKSLMSEAYFLRSLSYFYLVRLYRDVPLVLEPSESDDSDFYLFQSPEEEVLEQIAQDLKANRDFAPTESFPTIAENKGRASKAAFDALLADIALWRFQYEEVLTHIGRIERIEDLELMPSSRWFQLYYPGNSLESIFEFQFDGNRNQRNGTFDLTQRNTRNYDPSQKAVEMFGSEYSKEIVRGQGATIARIGDDDFIIWKYVGQSADGLSQRAGAQQYSGNWIVYRYAEILLMKAEALSQLERYTEALFIINEIRERANVQPISPVFNRVAFEDAILEERALELAFEGKRWFDLLRMGRRNNFSRKGKLIEIIVSNVPSTQKRILSAKLTSPNGWYLPVYKDEIERNKNLVQNPYYDF
ncbi:MAG TPA: RagB/SusD family nutrient uptake outer membrane protein [Mariniphaga anaerophila]|uniref:RagB/SusD family nutrient uptake outer membrane protein n=1 Tax=Mariniphaga anaerophila TaxID=1484053 RepID=A0A831LBZ3_9BACT|nr:RagB/SusD family nutrient uptake outer membrane protein [Mariniphaga anaerophila]